MNHLEYTDYFRQIAKNHVDIPHEKEDEKGKQQNAFARLVLSAEPWRQLELKEFLNNLNHKLSFPCLLVESYDASYQFNQSDKLKYFAGAFMIIDKKKKDDFDQRDEILSKCETIGEEIIAFINHDLTRTAKKKQYGIDLDDFTMEKLGPINTVFYGIRVDFEFYKSHAPELVFKPEKFQ